MTDQHTLITDGIDTLVTNASTMGDIKLALLNALQLGESHIRSAYDLTDSSFQTLQRQLYATIHTLRGGEFAFKVDLDGSEPRDYSALARQFAQALDAPVVMMDESTSDPAACILIQSGAPDEKGHLEDAEPEGFWFRRHPAFD